MVRSKVKPNVDEFIERLGQFFPSVTFEIGRETLPGSDAWVRIRVPSISEVDMVLRKAVELQNDWYIERGVYIEVSVSATGPLQ